MQTTRFFRFAQINPSTLGGCPAAHQLIEVLAERRDYRMFRKIARQIGRFYSLAAAIDSIARKAYRSDSAHLNNPRESSHLNNPRDRQALMQMLRERYQEQLFNTIIYGLAPQMVQANVSRNSKRQEQLLEYGTTLYHLCNAILFARTRKQVKIYDVAE